MMIRFAMACAVLLTSSVEASGEDYTCPGHRYAAAGEAPAGWEVRRDPGSRGVSSAVFFDGDPVNNASLAPSREVRFGDDEIAIWPLTPLIPTDQPVWLVCGYEGTSVLLARSLPLSIRECRTYDTPRSPITRIVCE